MKVSHGCLWLVVVQSCFTMGNAFAPAATKHTATTNLAMAAGDDGDSEWVKALMENSPEEPGAFEKEMKMKGLLGTQGKGDTKMSANAKLIQWLEQEGEVYLSEESSWGEAPHSMAISTETKDEITNESSGRGLLARRDITEGADLLKIPMKICLTRKSARKALGKDAIQNGMNEYLALACQLIHERSLGEESYYAPYMGVLPRTDEVNPTFTWSDDDLAFLEGSPVIAATRSLQMKLKREYDDLLGGEDGLIAKFPDRFPAEVRCWKSHYMFIFITALTFFSNSALHKRKLDLGIYHALLSCHSFEESEGRRSTCHGSVCGSYQPLAILASLH
jgi:hypothetical protein